MTVQTLVPSAKADARKAADKAPKLSGAASLFQGILAKEMERGRPAGGPEEGKGARKALAASGVKDDAARPLAQNTKTDLPEGVTVGKKQTVKTREEGQLAQELSVTGTPVSLAALPGLPQPPSSEPSETRKPSGDSLKVKGKDALGQTEEAPLWPKADKKALQRPGEDTPVDPRLIQVVDRRTAARQQSAEARKEEAVAVEASPKAVEASTPGLKTSSSQEEVRIQYTSTTGFTPDGAGGRVQAPVSRAAAESLYAKLQDRSNFEIVDRARIVLKDGGQGEIRLIIKPEALGEVKIRLNLEEGHLAGKIIVENMEVRDVFQKNMESLLDSFRQGGFTGLDIQVSVGDRGGSQGDYREKAALLESYALAVPSTGGESPVPASGYRQNLGTLDLVI